MFKNELLQPAKYHTHHIHLQVLHAHNWVSLLLPRTTQFNNLVFAQYIRCQLQDVHHLQVRIPTISQQPEATLLFGWGNSSPYVKLQPTVNNFILYYSKKRTGSLFLNCPLYTESRLEEREEREVIADPVICYARFIQVLSASKRHLGLIFLRSATFSAMRRLTSRNLLQFSCIKSSTSCSSALLKL